MTLSTPRNAFGDLLRRVLAPLNEVSLIDRIIGRPYALARIPLVVVTCDAQRGAAATRPVNRQGVL